MKPRVAQLLPLILGGMLAGLLLLVLPRDWGGGGGVLGGLGGGGRPPGSRPNRRSAAGSKRPAGPLIFPWRSSGRMRRAGFWRS